MCVVCGAFMSRAAFGEQIQPFSLNALMTYKRKRGNPFPGVSKERRAERTTAIGHFLEKPEISSKAFLSLSNNTLNEVVGIAD